MLIRRLRKVWTFKGSKKGFTLMELIVALFVTGVLIVALSAMLTPALNAYTRYNARTAAARVAGRLMSEVCDKLLGASRVYVTTNIASLPFVLDGGDYVRTGDVLEYGGFSRYATKGTNPSSSNYLDYYNKLALVEPYETTKKTMIVSGLYENCSLYSKDNTGNKTSGQNSFYVKPVENANDGDSLTCLEINLTVKNGDVYYSQTKIITIYNMVISGEVIRLANISWAVPPVAVAGTRYYSVWYTKA